MIISIVNNKIKKSYLFSNILILLLCFTILFGTFCFTNPYINTTYIISYFLDPLLILLNFLPIILIFYLIFVISNRLWLSYFLTTIIFILPSIINKYKIVYRDFPFIFEDISLFFEAMKMTEEYKLIINFGMVILIVFYVITTLILFNLKTHKSKPRLKIYFISIIMFISLFSYNNFYLNDNIYKKIGNEKLINPMSKTQKFQIRGFVYSFINSSKKYVYPIPRNYNERKVIDKLNSYLEKKIENDKKVNIIAIMLEAYADFSNYDSFDFNIDIYEKYNKLLEESYHGTLISNVFVGGTIDTERGFLTGYLNHNNYYKPTNSFVWYLREQGYYTEAMHPIYGWFYNRRNVNKNIGFMNYDYLENKYNTISNDFLMDNDFLKFIIEGYENNKKRNVPYFNFTVTYQNHGPYDEKNTEIESDGTEYITKKNSYNKKTYKLVNNYFNGINITNNALWDLINYFRGVNDPTVILLFGDHKPNFGIDNGGYKMLGINMDISTEEGFMNYYSVPYVIWGNTSAKTILNKDFVGKGNTISPNYLMAELFDYIDIEGNSYMQFITEKKSSIPIINQELFNVHTQHLNDYEKIQYYYINNFRSR